MTYTCSCGWIPCSGWKIQAHPHWHHRTTSLVWRTIISVDLNWQVLQVVWNADARHEGIHYSKNIPGLSNFFENDCLDTPISESIIECMKVQFAHYGIPETLISDNGSQCSSQAFRKFAKKWLFNHVTIWLRNSQANDAAQVIVKMVKS